MRQVSSSRAGKQVQSQRALDHLSSFLFFCPHENLSKQAKLIEIKVIFWRVGLSGCLITKWPPSRSLQQCVNGGHRSETMLFDPTSQEISKNKAFSGLYLFLPWGQEEQKAPLCSNSEAFPFWRSGPPVPTVQPGQIKYLPIAISNSSTVDSRISSSLTVTPTAL